MKIQLTKFAERHFSKNFTGTKILDYTKKDFIDRVNFTYSVERSILIDGYAPFCKLLSIKNFTEAKTGTLPITLENYQYLRSGYSSRTKEELPVLSQWFEIPRMFVPVSDYLVIVLYTKDQLLKEHENKKDGDFELDHDTDYGVVAILGQMSPGEEPMKPITMMRNALGTKYGGAGVDIDPVLYQKSYGFWSKNATIK